MRRKKPSTASCLPSATRHRYEKIMLFISNSIEMRGTPPTNAEIAEYLGLSSQGTVGKHLRNMEDLGMISRSNYHGRGITIKGESTLTSTDKEVLTEMKSRGVSLGEIYTTWRTLKK